MARTIVFSHKLYWPSTVCEPLQGTILLCKKTYYLMRLAPIYLSTYSSYNIWLHKLCIRLLNHVGSIPSNLKYVNYIMQGPSTFICYYWSFHANTLKFGWSRTPSLLIGIHVHPNTIPTKRCSSMHYSLKLLSITKWLTDNANTIHNIHTIHTSLIHYHNGINFFLFSDFFLMKVR